MENALEKEVVTGTFWSEGVGRYGRVCGSGWVGCVVGGGGGSADDFTKSKVMAGLGRADMLCNAAAAATS